ncbi:unnamed protein product, partial [Mesorhabditis belari]|uniref:E3 ubiquitin-protein ligase n=1 Tax=Mesorhabditis belari TaxID=2138241 RepID=A0AAF3F514_9BILA
MGREESGEVLSREPLIFRPSLLLSLPNAYDGLFSHFFNRSCLGCGTVPSRAFICLLCSQLVCVGDCCKITQSDMDQEDHISNEVDRHVQQYEHGVAPFLVLNSSLIVIVKKGRGLIWGTVYLDVHGEEDRMLKRGKPLYLSEQRWEALQRDWVEKDFTRASSPWIDIERFYQYLRDPSIYEYRYI